MPKVCVAYLMSMVCVGGGEQEVLAKCNAAAGSSMSLIRVVRAHASESTELAR